MEHGCWFSYSENGSIAYTLPCSDTLYRVFFLWLGEKYLGEFLKTSFEFATGHVWWPFSASDRLRCIWCEGECIKYFSWLCCMWRVFRTTVRCRRDSGMLLWDISLLKPDNANAELQMYGYCVMSVTVADYSTWSFEVPETFSDRTKKERNALIILVLIAAFG